MGDLVSVTLAALLLETGSIEMAQICPGSAGVPAGGTLTTNVYGSVHPGQLAPPEPPPELPDDEEGKMIPPEPPVPPAPPPVPPPLAPSPALPPVPLLELDVSMRVVEEHVTEVADTTVAARTTGKAPFDTLMTSSSFRMVYSR